MLVKWYTNITKSNKNIEIHILTISYDNINLIFLVRFT